MKKCDCYHIQPTIQYRYNSVNGNPISYTKQKGVCWGTREQDECYCDGDRTRCDFYPEVIEKALQEIEPKFGEWISVKDRLPEDKSKCLIWTTIYFIPDHNDDANHYDSYEVSTYYEGHGFVSHNGMCAKYWMPLPEPPKGE